MLQDEANLSARVSNKAHVNLYEKEPILFRNWEFILVVITWVSFHYLWKSVIDLELQQFLDKLIVDHKCVKLRWHVGGFQLRVFVKQLYVVISIERKEIHYVGQTRM